jgi:hypothetical protein
MLNENTRKRFKERKFFPVYCGAIYVSQIDRIIDKVNKEYEESLRFVNDINSKTEIVEENTDMVENLIGLKWIARYILNIRIPANLYLNDESIRIIFYLS